ncbi:hypothetical protein BGZ76_000395 [Entomortierella beljakovae]|nr:hypothetical protein BGZ76_000395 [Entomortierella beljakovae]
MHEKSRIPPQDVLTSLSLTHVQFRPNDLYSKIFAHLTLSPLAITCGYIAVILTTRDITAVTMGVGQALNECINYILKKNVKHARPTEYLGNGYGMPSSHSQFMAYFATYMITLMYRSGASSDTVSSHLVSVIVVIWALIVIYSRVHLYYHTAQQVTVGSLCGIIFALGYYFFVQKYLRTKGMQDWMMDNSIGRWMYLVDREEIDSVYQWEWTQFQEWRKQTQHK